MSDVRGLVPTVGASFAQISGGPSEGSNGSENELAPVHSGPRRGPNPASSSPMIVNMAIAAYATWKQKHRIAPECQPLPAKADHEWPRKEVCHAQEV